MHGRWSCSKTTRVFSAETGIEHSKFEFANNRVRVFRGGPRDFEREGEGEHFLSTTVAGSGRKF